MDLIPARPLLFWTRPDPPNFGALENAGLEAFCLPLLRNETLPAHDTLRGRLAKAFQADALAFVSRAGVHSALALAPELITSKAALFAVGPATAKAVADAFGRPALWPQGAESAALGPLIVASGVRAVALLTAPDGLSVLPDQLADHGIGVDIIFVYQRVPQVPGVVELAALQHEAQRLVLIATSQALLDALVPVLEALPERARDRPILCASARIAAHAKQLGFRDVRNAGGADQAALIAAYWHD